MGREASLSLSFHNIIVFSMTNHQVKSNNPKAFCGNRGGKSEEENGSGLTLINLLNKLQPPFHCVSMGRSLSLYHYRTVACANRLTACAKAHLLFKRDERGDLEFVTKHLNSI